MASFEPASDLAEGDLSTVASHEAGHALASWLLPDADPAYKVGWLGGTAALALTCASFTQVTIVRRGATLGLCSFFDFERAANLENQVSGVPGCVHSSERCFAAARPNEG